MNSFYDKEELQQLGFRHIGENVLISRRASFYGTDKMWIGDHSRVDDYCLLSGSVTLGSYVHISAYCALYGGNYGIVFGDCSGISAKGVIYAITDDFSGEYMSNSTLPKDLRNVYGAKVQIGKYCQIGAGSIVLPGALLEEGAALGCMSLAKSVLPAWTISAGIPSKVIKKRKKNMKILAERLDKV